MLFNSLEYLLFLPGVVIWYYIFGQFGRWVLLLTASYVFYMVWKPEYLVLILFSTIVDFSVARFLGQTENPSLRKAVLAVSLTTNLGLLFIFKYFNFFLAEFHAWANTPADVWSAWNIILPVGISFYTFQTMGYTIDVYQGKAKPELHFGKFAVFVAYFPQLVAGPIERFSNLNQQLWAAHPFRYENLSKGGRLILYGFFVKMVIADNLSIVADTVFATPEAFNRLDTLIGMLSFGFQIYADFFGYSLISIGSARLMGVKLMDNFRAPYLATSIGDFWQRWHISLSTWFRDYLYIPLGGNRTTQWRWALNILIVFGLSGLWHGANWTFLVWGGIHGLIYLQEKFLKVRLPLASLNRVSGMIKTFLLVQLAWVFFRADSVQQAWQMLERVASGATGPESLQLPLATLALFGFFIVLEAGMNGQRIDRWLEGQNWIKRWSLYAVLLYCILALSGTVNHPFIYFQF